MRLLLDENLPKRLKSDFPDHDVFTVRQQGWNGIKNGELIRLMLLNNFSVLLTFDKNLQHQQNFKKYEIVVFVLTAPNNTYKELTLLSGIINTKLRLHLSGPGPIIIGKND